MITTFGDIAEYEGVSASGTYGATAILGDTGSANWVMQMATFKSATTAHRSPSGPAPGSHSTHGHSYLEGEQQRERHPL